MGPQKRAWVGSVQVITCYQPFVMCGASHVRMLGLVCLTEAQPAVSPAGSQAKPLGAAADQHAVGLMRYEPACQLEYACTHSCADTQCAAHRQGCCRRTLARMQLHPRSIPLTAACCALLCHAVQVLLLSLLDLPFSISPVVTGLMLMLLYGRAGWFAQAIAENGLTIVFAFPGASIR